MLDVSNDTERIARLESWAFRTGQTMVAFKSRLDRVETKVDRVETRLDRMQVDIDTLKADTETLKADTNTLKADMSYVLRGVDLLLDHYGIAKSAS